MDRQSGSGQQGYRVKLAPGIWERDDYVAADDGDAVGDRARGRDPLLRGHFAALPLGVTCTLDADARTLTVDELALRVREAGAL